MEVLWRTWWVLVIVSLCAVLVAPRPRIYPKKKLPFTEPTMKYLMKYGYLPASDLETGNLRTDEQLKEAIKTLQKFGNIAVTGKVDEATEALMAGARCGVADIPDLDQDRGRRKRFAIYSGPPWDHMDLTWSLRSHLDNLDYGQVRRDLHAALAVWSQDSNLTFREVNSDDADLLVRFHRGEHGDGYAFDGPGRILAHAFFPGEDRGGDVHFDEEETWLLEYQHTGNDGEGTRLLMVAAHEFGHSLGLSHSSDPTSLMFPWYQTLGEHENFVLPEDDRRGIQQLYGAKNRWATIPKFNPGNGKQPWRPSYKPAVRPAAPPAPSTTTTSTTTTTTTTHRPFHRHHHHSPHPTAPSGKPNSCDTSYDAVSVIRRETYIFKDKYMWRFNDHGAIMVGYPSPILHLWKSLPSNLTHVDAVYERQDKKIVFFIGREMYLFDGNKLEPGYPKPLSSLGLPHQVDHIDAAMVWGYNSKTYFFSGNIYWRFDEDEQRVELDYPREITIMWKGMDSHFDAAFQWKDGKTYFFKNKGFWKLNDMKMRAENKHPLPSAAFWMNCSDIGHFPSVETKENQKWSRLKVSSSPTTDGSLTVSANVYLCALIMLFHFLPT